MAGPLKYLLKYLRVLSFYLPVYILLTTGNTILLLFIWTKIMPFLLESVKQSDNVFNSNYKHSVKKKAIAAGMSQ
jgi:hypothetical protein